MAQLVEALRYKPGGRGFFSRLVHWDYSPGVDSFTNQNGYLVHLLRGKGGRCLGSTTLPPSCADCLGILRASNSWSSKGLSRLVMG